MAQSSPLDRIIHSSPLRPSRGLSLLEVIIATAILAGSGMILFSIIGLGSKYALRAEELTFSHHHAQSILDEWLAQPLAAPGEQSGPIEEAPDWSYRVESKATSDPLLQVVTVEIFHASPLSALSPSSADSAEPIYRLSRWVRVTEPPATGVGL